MEVMEEVTEMMSNGDDESELSYSDSEAYSPSVSPCTPESEEV